MCRRIRLAHILLIGVCCLLLSACSNAQEGRDAVRQTAVGSCGLALPQAASDTEIIWSLIAAESRYMVAQDIDALMRLWATDAQITDLHNTPQNTSDDQTWKGQDAIRYRYARNVFPSAPSSAQPSDLDIQVSGNSAVVTATTRINAEVSPAGDLWQLVKRDGCWLLLRLEFNRER